MAHRLSVQAEADLDEIWLYVAKGSGRLEIADRLIDSLIERFLLLARFPYMGRSRDQDLKPGLRSFPVGSYLILYRLDGEDAFILRVLHASRDIEALLRG